LAGGDGAGLAVGFGGEPFSGDVGYPDLDWPKALGAQPGAVCGYPVP
jgi:hypothetical protein